MCKRVKLTTEEVEKEMQAVRENQDISGKMERVLIKNLVENARSNSMIGDKLLMVINPLYIHIPDWQREIKIAKALSIGNNYNKYKWEIPKVLLYKEKLYVVDGQHRIYGAFKGNIDKVVVEIMECPLDEAIDLFINQSKDRSKMQPKDIYRAALAGNKPDYIALKSICNSHNVAVKGDKKEGNPVGTLTSISDGIDLVRTKRTVLESMLGLLGKLQWNGYADSYNGKAYTAKIIRALKSMYAYYDGRTDEMEKILVEKCIGTEFFVENVMEKTQAQIFDYLSRIVTYEMENPFKNKVVNPKKKKA